MGLPSAREIELAGLRAWPGIEVEWDGAWVRRASNGYTKRANSVQCLDPADDGDASGRLAAACAWFERRGLPPVFRQHRLAGPAVAQALDDEGWRSVDESRVVAMELQAMEADPRGAVHPVDDPAFLDAQRRLKHLDDAAMARLEAILGVLRVPAAGIVLRDASGNPVSSALMAVADGIVITGSVVTGAAERRRGYAAAMMRTGLAWAKSEGAAFAALNVEAGNAPALALYHGLGYRPQYDYVYRVRSAA